MNKKKQTSPELNDVLEQLLLDAGEATIDALIEDEGVSPDSVVTSMRSLAMTHVQKHQELSSPPPADSSSPRAENYVALSNLISMRRREIKLSRERLAKKAGLDVSEVEGIEIASQEAVTPRALFMIEKCLKLPPQSLSEVVGFVRVDDQGFNDRITAFAAHAPGFDRLTREQRKMLHDFVEFLADRHG